MIVVRTSLHNSSIHGIGVFADEPIRKGQVVWQFDPRLDIAIPVDDRREFPPAVQEYLKRLAYIEVIDGRKMMILCADNGKHVNHSDNPNLLDTFDGRQQYAARDIAVGEELTCNYFASDLEAAAKLGLEVHHKE
jgi:SET domain-containing protein